MIADRILKGADVIDAREAFDPKERAQYLNGSEALTCIRKQWYKKHEPHEEEAQDWGYARRGKHGEKYLVERLKAANVPTYFMGEDQVQIVDDDLRISVTPDGLVELPGKGDATELWGVEFKTIDPRTNRGNLPKIEHVTQLQIAMAMIERHRDEFPELRDLPIVGGIVLYMDASNYNDLPEFRVAPAPKILDRLKGRANRVLDSKAAVRLPREGKEQGGTECKQRCGFRDICGVDGAGTSTGQGHKGGGDVAVQVAALVEAKGQEAFYKAQKDDAAERIKAIMKQHGTDQLEVDGHLVKLTVRAGSVSYATIVKEHLPGFDTDLYRGAPTEVLTVK
jgi:hypothetical protein